MAPAATAPPLPRHCATTDCGPPFWLPPPTTHPVQEWEAHIKAGTVKRLAAPMPGARGRPATAPAATAALHRLAQDDDMANL